MCCLLLVVGSLVVCCVCVDCLSSGECCLLFAVWCLLVGMCCLLFVVC